MKRIFILFFFPIVNYSQIFYGYVKDSVTSEPLTYANIVFSNKNIGTYSDEKGYFNVQKNYSSDVDTLIISSVGYDTKKIPLKSYKSNETINLNINLSQTSITLEEVVIKPKFDIQYSEYNLGEKKIDNVSLSSLIGNQIATFIINPYKKEGKVNGLVLHLKKVKNIKKTAQFNIKFYDYDLLHDKPGNIISSQNLIINPKNSTYKIKIDLKDYNIKFPKEGICVAIEFVSLDESIKYNEIIGPALVFTNSTEKNTWFGYRDKGWKKSFLNHKDNKGNLYLNLIVELPKNQ